MTNYFGVQTEKIELEKTVVDETKGRDSFCGQGNRRFSGLFIFLAYIIVQENDTEHSDDSLHSVLNVLYLIFTLLQISIQLCLRAVQVTQRQIMRVDTE